MSGRTHGFSRTMLGKEALRNAMISARTTDLGYIKGGRCDYRLNKMAAIEAGADIAVSATRVTEQKGWCSIKALPDVQMAEAALGGVELLGFYRCAMVLREKMESGKKFRRAWLEALPERVATGDKGSSDSALYLERKGRGDFLETA